MSDFDDNIPNEMEDVKDMATQRIIEALNGIDTLAGRIENQDTKTLLAGIGLAAHAIVAQLSLNSLETESV